MEQFNLEKYLENPSRKVVTRDGREVEILKTNFRGYKQIIGVVKNRDNKDDEVEQWDGQGNFRSLFGESKYDLFFADEEEELTEFEKMLASTISAWQISMKDSFGEGNYQLLKKDAKELLDLARKEVEKEITKEVEQKAINHTYAYQNGYENGKYDTLKDLPKWKKAEKDEELDCHVAIQQNDRVVLSDFVQKDEYYITLNVLKKLPKEE